eukprot:TRINITY_DN2457_c0_g2_i1.p1 TRINITY_DN2457_c0_g2~~TRINITY_DN2457_c0_g2_i1.p1  ORF type:complete len:293 (-),score=55.03 TRINITY_DN2457_c0_g2_i1:44-823(-)
MSLRAGQYIIDILAHVLKYEVDIEKIILIFEHLGFDLIDGLVPDELLLVLENSNIRTRIYNEMNSIDIDLIDVKTDDKVIQYTEWKFNTNETYTDIKSIVVYDPDHTRTTIEYGVNLKFNVDIDNPQCKNYVNGLWQDCTTIVINATEIECICEGNTEYNVGVFGNLILQEGTKTGEVDTTIKIAATTIVAIVVPSVIAICAIIAIANRKHAKKMKTLLRNISMNDFSEKSNTKVYSDDTTTESSEKVQNTDSLVSDNI